MPPAGTTHRQGREGGPSPPPAGAQPGVSSMSARTLPPAQPHDFLIPRLAPAPIPVLSFRRPASDATVAQPLRGAGRL